MLGIVVREWMRGAVMDLMVVARKLAVMLMSMLKSGEAYEPLHGFPKDEITAA